jgi:tungstate transport system permease protein
MIDDASPLMAALTLIVRLDPVFLGIVGLSLRVTLTAVCLAALIGLPLGALLAVSRFRGRLAMIVAINALMGLPPVVVGLVFFLLLSRSGPLGGFGLLFTPSAMIIAQASLHMMFLISAVAIAVTDRIMTGTLQMSRTEH